MTERPENTPPAAGPADGTGPGRPKGRVALILVAAVVLGAAAGLAGVYGIEGGARNVVASAPAPSATPSAGSDATCAAASETGRRIADLAKGELAAFAPTLSPTRIPDLAFLDAQGKATRLSAVGGNGLKLVNVWATWCVPCRKEMPALDALQGAMGGDKVGGTAGGTDFEVVAINIDTRDPDKPKSFMKEIGVQNLALYADPKAQSFQDLRAVGRGFGLPTTMLVTADGCEIGHIAGPAEWASEDAQALIRAALSDAGPKS
ncbi:TlpA family protein disulfide reductase [Ancylobacter sp. MQZ15Z-1]|uniref:TlpA family protein disulfide reductase n=1 Tax=Ancylobacter mangrovi TaxID=2972472 RepID=A0A9X2T6P7_9HYPH|nr:TlpA disulfide reductase family protein [Ancylobacter mangrovi]MCS0495188.1 TlpA family protein disulfide reductase [Ancylobacter mangrovi]